MLLKLQGHAMVHVVSRWLPIVTAWIWFQVVSCGMYDEESGTGASFVQVLPLVSPIHLYFTNSSRFINHHVISAVWSW
jgi:hypothetical protein